MLSQVAIFGSNRLFTRFSRQTSIRPFSRLIKIAPAPLEFKDGAAFVAFAKDRHRERSARFCFFFARRKLSARRRRERNIRLDWIGLGKFLVPYPLSLTRLCERVSKLVWKTPSWTRSKKKKKKKNKILTMQFLLFRR